MTLPHTAAMTLAIRLPILFKMIARLWSDGLLVDITGKLAFRFLNDGGWMTQFHFTFELMMPERECSYIHV